jgi:response regulator RpfG family c-di-GMP phosphodiesterase
MVLDIMLPDMEGFEVARRLGARRAEIPIIFLTARDATEDKIRGLTVGGDDYVTKPFSLEELIARIRTVLRRTGQADAESSRLEFEDIELDDDTREVARAGEPIDLTMGNVNVVWQGDAAAYVLQSLSLCASPPAVLNVSGPETVSVRWLANRFADLLGTAAPTFVGGEAPTALLSNAARCHRLFGYPRVPLAQMVEWVADWVARGGPTLSKPTHFEVRDGRF